MSRLLRALAERAMHRAAPVRSQTAMLQSRWRRAPADGVIDDIAPAEPSATPSAHADESPQHERHAPKHALRTGQEPALDAAAAGRRRSLAQADPRPAAARHEGIDAHATAMAAPPFILPVPLVQVATPLRSGDEPPPRDPARPVHDVPVALVRNDAPLQHTAAETHAAARAARRRNDSTHHAAPTEVHVSIGRIELTALAPPVSARPAAGSHAVRASRSTVALADYLRNGAGRRP